MGEDDNYLNTTHHVVVLELAGGSDGVKHAVVDDCVHGERHTVRGENLLGWHFKNLKIIVTIILMFSLCFGWS